MDQRQPLERSIFHCQSIGDAHEVSSSRIHRVGERTSTGSRITHGQAAQLPGRTDAGCRRWSTARLSTRTIVPRCRIRRRDSVNGRCGGRPTAMLRGSRRRAESLPRRFGSYCGRLTTGLLRAQAFVERDAVTTALIRLRSVSSDCAESDSGPVAHRANMGSELCG